MSYAWVTNARTKQQCAIDGDKVDGWPEPCETCGAHWKLTPAGRWLIVHTEQSGPVSFPRYVSEPKRLGGLIPPPREAA